MRATLEVPRSRTRASKSSITVWESRKSRCRESSNPSFRRRAPKKAPGSASPSPRGSPRSTTDGSRLPASRDRGRPSASIFQKQMGLCMESRVLFVDDDAAMRDVVGSALVKRGFEVVCLGSGAEAMATLANSEFDAIVTDLQMQGMDGLEFCRRAMERRPGVPVVVVTAFGNVETAVGAIRAGAYDFVAKPLQMDDLVFRLTRAVQHRRLGEEVKRLRTAVGAISPGGLLIGDSPPMKEVYRSEEHT